MIVLHEDEPPEPAEHCLLVMTISLEAFKAEYDDYPDDDPPPCPADAERAARAWEADRLTRGEP
jgi:hypothetical protein